MNDKFKIKNNEDVECVECGCIGNCSCGHEPYDKEKCCTLDSFLVCPCCNLKTEDNNINGNIKTDK